MEKARDEIETAARLEIFDFWMELEDASGFQGVTRVQSGTLLKDKGFGIVHSPYWYPYIVAIDGLRSTMEINECSQT